jgi:hypothetical protein
MNLSNYTLIDTVTGTILDPLGCVLIRDSDSPTLWHEDGSPSDSEICEIGREHGESLSVLLSDPVQDLVDRYGSWGEHPRHCRADWRKEVVDGETNLGYWDWTIQQEEIHG